MEKMSLERFNEIKRFVQQMHDIYQKIASGEIAEEDYGQYETMVLEFEKNIEELKNSDLSDIDYSDWEGFVFFFDVNLGGTNANLDFSIISIDTSIEYLTIRDVKDCNVRNFDFDNICFSVNAFDDEFIREHKDEHWFLTYISDVPEEEKCQWVTYSDSSVPLNIVKKYSLHTKKHFTSENLHLERLVDEKIDLRTIDYIYQFNLDYNLNRGLSSRYFKPSNIKELLLEVNKLVGQLNDSDNLSIDDETILRLNRSVILACMTEKKYDAIQEDPELANLLEDYIVSFPPEKSALKKSYATNNLTLKDISENLDLFKGKKVAWALPENIKENFKKYNIDESVFDYVLTNFPEIIKGFSNQSIYSHGFNYFFNVISSIDINKGIEENRKKIIETSEDLLSKNKGDNGIIKCFSEFIPFSICTKYQTHTPNIQKALDEILKYSSDEFISNNPIARNALFDTSVIKVIAIIGLENFVEFNKKNNNALVNDNYALTKDILNRISNDSRTEDRFSVLRFRAEDATGPMSYEEMEEAFFRVLMNPVSTQGSIESLSEDFVKKYKQRCIDEFVDDEDTRNKLMRVFEKYSLKYIQFILCRNGFEYGVLKGVKDLSEEEIQKKILENIKQKLQRKRGENEDSYIKECFPELFLDADAPEELKAKFYISNRKELKLDVKDLANPEFIPFLIGKDFSSSFFPETTWDKEEFRTFIPIEKWLDFVNNGLPQGEKIDENHYIYSFVGNWIHHLDNNKYYEKIDQIDKSSMRKRIIRYPFKYWHKFNFQDIESLMDENLDEKEWDDKFFQIVLSKIKTNDAYYSEMDSDILKERFPELFLDENAPQELKDKFYSSCENTNGSFSISDITNPEYLPFFKGKDIGGCNLSSELRRIYSVIGMDMLLELSEMGYEDIDFDEKLKPEDKKIRKDELHAKKQELFEIYSSSDTNLEKFKNRLDKYSDFLAKKELGKKLGISAEDWELRSQEDDIKAKLDETKKKYKKELFSLPGLLLYYPEEKLDELDIHEYKDIRRLSKFKVSVNYRNDLAEQILGKMYGFLGYGGCKSVFEVPQINEEIFDSLIARSSELAKDSFIEKYEITGNIRVISEFFKKIISASGEKPTSKKFFKIAKSVNQRISEGYDDDVFSLLKEVLNENGYNIEEKNLRKIADDLINEHTKYKTSVVSEKIDTKIDEKVPFENNATRKIMKELLKVAIIESLTQTERIDLDIIKEFFQVEFAKKNDNGEPKYSAHVTDYMMDLVGIADSLSKSVEYGKILNSSVVDILEEESQKIKAGWIRKIIPVLDAPTLLTVDEFNSYNDNLYGSDSEYEIETIMKIAPKDGSQEGLEKAVKLLAKNGYEFVLTFEKAETMFNGLQEPFSINFRNYFLSHKNEFIANPDYYSAFAKAHNGFEDFINNQFWSTRFNKGILSVRELINEIQKSTFENVQEGEHELAFYGRIFGWTQEEFERAKEILKEMKAREYQSIPPETVKKRKI